MAIAVTPFVWMFKAPEVSEDSFSPDAPDITPSSALMIAAISSVPESYEFWLTG